MMEVSPRSMDSGSKALSERFDYERVDAKLFCKVSEGIRWKAGGGVGSAPTPIGEKTAIRRTSIPRRLGRRGGSLRDGHL